MLFAPKSLLRLSFSLLAVMFLVACQSNINSQNTRSEAAKVKPLSYSKKARSRWDDRVAYWHERREVRRAKYRERREKRMERRLGMLAARSSLNGRIEARRISTFHSRQLRDDNFTSSIIPVEPKPKSKKISRKHATPATVTKRKKVAKIVRKSARKKPKLTKTANAPKQEKKKQVATIRVPKGKYGSMIAKYAKQHGVPYKLAKAVVQVESSFRPNATGAVGEIGLMQIRLSTARGMGFKGSPKQLYDPATNLYWGMKYLGKAHKLSGGTTCGTILKYNAGHGAKRMNSVSANYCKKVKRILT